MPSYQRTGIDGTDAEEGGGDGEVDGGGGAWFSTNLWSFRINSAVRASYFGIMTFGSERYKNTCPPVLVTYTGPKVRASKAFLYPVPSST